MSLSTWNSHSPCARCCWKSSTVGVWNSNGVAHFLYDFKLAVTSTWSHSYAAFRLACRLPHCRFDGDFCTTAQAPLAAEGWPSGKQRHANRLITLPLCPPRQIADSWILFNSGAMPLGDKAKATWPLRAATLKQQAMITRRSGKAASGKLVWNQHYRLYSHVGQSEAYVAGSALSLCTPNPQGAAVLSHQSFKFKMAMAWKEYIVHTYQHILLGVHVFAVWDVYLSI